MTPDLENRLHGEIVHEWAKRLSTMEAELGQAVALAFANAIIDAAVTYATGAAGMESTYNSLQRRADEIAGSLVESAARHQ